LAAYRDANRRVRTTPPPAFFDVLFGFEDRAVERDEIRTLLEFSPRRADSEKLIAELDGLRARVLEAYQKIVDLAPESV
jgi:hypothetical protein